MKIDFSSMEFNRKQKVLKFVEEFNARHGAYALAKDFSNSMRIIIVPKYENVELVFDVIPKIDDDGIYIPVFIVKSIHHFVENKFTIPLPVFQFGDDFNIFDIIDVDVERFDWIENFTCGVHNLSNALESFCCFDDFSNNSVFSISGFLEGSERIAHFLANNESDLIASLYKNLSFDSYFKFLSQIKN